MGNLADLIEEFILRKLTGEREEATVLKRNELAEELNCAPSQISYVLSTRFTAERGFIVQSRRGSGGFVRIVRVPAQVIIYENSARQVKSEIQEETLEMAIDQLRSQGIISNREAELMLQFFRLTRDSMDARNRAAIFKSLLLKLADFSRGGD